jgi:hypothetical protein
MRLFALPQESDLPTPFGFSLCRGTGGGLGGFANAFTQRQGVLALFGGNICRRGVSGHRSF